LKILCMCMCASLYVCACVWVSMCVCAYLWICLRDHVNSSWWGGGHGRAEPPTRPGNEHLNIDMSMLKYFKWTSHHTRIEKSHLCQKLDQHDSKSEQKQRTNNKTVQKWLPEDQYFTLRFIVIHVEQVVYISNVSTVID